MQIRFSLEFLIPFAAYDRLFDRKSSLLSLCLCYSPPKSMTTITENNWIWFKSQLWVKWERVGEEWVLSSLHCSLASLLFTLLKPSFIQNFFPMKLFMQKIWSKANERQTLLQCFWKKTKRKALIFISFGNSEIFLSDIWDVFLFSERKKLFSSLLIFSNKFSILFAQNFKIDKKCLTNGKIKSFCFQN